MSNISTEAAQKFLIYSLALASATSGGIVVVGNNQKFIKPESELDKKTIYDFQAIEEAEKKRARKKAKRLALKKRLSK